jgi:hypothetical protein
MTREGRAPRAADRDRERAPTTAALDHAGTRGPRPRDGGGTSPVDAEVTAAARLAEVNGHPITAELRLQAKVEDQLQPPPIVRLDVPVDGALPAGRPTRP